MVDLECRVQERDEVMGFVHWQKQVVGFKLESPYDWDRKRRDTKERESGENYP